MSFSFMAFTLFEDSISLATCSGEIDSLFSRELEAQESSVKDMKRINKNICAFSLKFISSTFINPNQIFLSKVLSKDWGFTSLSVRRYGFLFMGTKVFALPVVLFPPLAKKHMLTLPRALLHNQPRSTLLHSVLDTPIPHLPHSSALPSLL
jgi:hypothetical protein